MSTSESRPKSVLPPPEEMPTEELLVAVSGTDKASTLLSRYGVSDLAGRSVAEFVSDGLPPPAARRLASAFEVSRRIACHRVRHGGLFVASTIVFQAFHERLRHLKVEQFWVAMLDAKNRLRGEALISQGSLTSTPAHPREVFRPAIRAAASAIVCVHNHPSGDPEPSDLDFDLTRRLTSVGELVGIPLLDHVIIGDGGYVSFLDRGVIPR